MTGTVDPAPRRAQAARRRRAWQDPPTDDTTNARFGLVLLLLLTIFFVEGGGTELTDWIVTVLTLVLVVATFRLTAVTSNVPIFVLLVALAMLSVVIHGVTDSLDDWRAVGYLAQFLLLIGIGLALLQGVIRRSRVDAQTILGAIATYVLIGLSFGWLFQAVAIWDPDQFNIDPTDTAEFSEFSFITLTTVGFGNDHPTGALGGRLVVFEALLAQLFLAVFISRMVALYGRHADRGERDADAGAD